MPHRLRRRRTILWGAAFALAIGAVLYTHGRPTMPGSTGVDEPRRAAIKPPSKKPATDGQYRFPRTIHDDVADGLRSLTRSCPGEQSHGLCLDTSADVDPKGPPRCGPDSARPLKIRRRDPDVLPWAVMQLRQATERYEAEPDDGTRGAYATARLAEADLAFESYVERAQVRMIPATPTDHGVFSAALRPDLSDEANGVAVRYLEIAALEDPVASIAVSARLGQLARDAVDRWMAAPIPAGLTTGDHAEDHIDAHCDALGEFVDREEQRAIDRFQSCVHDASYATIEDTDLERLRAIAAWSLLCSRELGELRPDAFPELAEMMTVPAGEAWERARLHLVLRNHAYAADSLEAIPFELATAYERENLRGIALRGDGELAEAQVAFLRAITLDPFKPDAYYNLALLFAEHASVNVPIEAAIAAYQRSIPFFEQAIARATGIAKTTAETRLERTRVTLAQFEKFLRLQIESRANRRPSPRPSHRTRDGANLTTALVVKTRVVLCRARAVSL